MLDHPIKLKTKKSMPDPDLILPYMSKFQISFETIGGLAKSLWKKVRTRYFRGALSLDLWSQALALVRVPTRSTSSWCHSTSGFCRPSRSWPTSAWCCPPRTWRRRTPRRCSWKIKRPFEGGLHCTEVASLLITQQPPVRVPVFPIFFQMKIIDVAGVNQWHGLDESAK